MALRSLGASLLAKAKPGSLSRETAEERMIKPEIPGKGAIGTAARNLIQETAIVPPAPGSEKVIRAAPGVESASLPGIAAQNVPLVAGVGMPNIPAPVRPGAEGQPLFQGGVAPASQAGQAGRQAQVAAMTGSPVSAVAQARQAARQPQVQGAQAKVQGATPQIASTSRPSASEFGGRVIGGIGTGVQALLKKVGSASLIGALILPILSKAIEQGQRYRATLRGEKPKELRPMNLGQTFLSAPKPSYRGAFAQPRAAVSSGLRSLTQSVSRGVSRLRSLFRR